MKINYDRNVTAAKFKPSDLLWVHNEVVKRGRCKKFTFSWNGPYVVEQILKSVKYKLRACKSKRKRLDVHGNRLKRHYGEVQHGDTEDGQTKPTKGANKNSNIIKSVVAKNLINRAKKNVQRKTGI